MSRRANVERHGLNHLCGGSDPIYLCWEDIGGTVFGLDEEPVGGWDGSTFILSGWSVVSKITLPSSGTLQSLHGLFRYASGTPAATLVLYADSGGNPGALKAASAILAIPTSPPSTFNEVAQYGFTTALTAGDYWVGWIESAPGADNPLILGGSFATKAGGMNPSTPNDPFPTPDSTGSDTYACWAVIEV